MPKPLVSGLLGAAEIAGGIALEFVPGGQVFGTMLLSAGITTTASAISQALGNQNSLGITTRAPAALRQIVRGTQRVPGTIVYQSTTGSQKDQYNFVIAIAGHQVWAIENLYLDGRRVFWVGSGVGNFTRNGYNFGGEANGTTYVGPNGQNYNFGGLVFVDVRYGDQADEDVMATLTANDPNWAGSSGNYPWMGGCTYIYLKLEYSATMFPAGQPEIRFTVHGKCDIYDPRTGLKSYSTNPALHVADILTDPTWGLGDTTVNEDQLIAAANVCDEMVGCVPTEGNPDGSLTEARYAGHWYYDASVGPGEAIEVFLQTMGGRLTRQGAEWFIWPAYYQGPSFTWEPGILLDAPQWRPSRDPAELCNRVRGTYIAPQYPYNVAGDLYDANGWYDGTIQNNFPFAFRPDDFPEYAQDVLHGYSYDEWLAEDSGATAAWSSSVAYAAGTVILDGAAIYRAVSAVSAGTAPVSATVAWNPATAYTTGQAVTWLGVVYTALAGTTGAQPDTSPSDWQASPWIPFTRQLPQDIAYKGVLSVSQAQRLAKYALLRNRWQGQGSLKTKMAAFGAAGIDTGYLIFPALGWTSGQLLELADEPAFVMEDQPQPDGRSVPSLALRWTIQAIDPSIYEWDTATEELSVYDVPASPSQASYVVAAPTSMTLVSGASTAVEGVDGIVQPRVLVQWDDPADVLVTQIVIQFRSHGVTPWQAGPIVPVGLGEAYVPGVVSQAYYDFRIAAMRANGAMSSWVEIDDYQVSTVLSITSYTGVAVAAPGTLVAVANSDGTATIQVNNFTATYGGLSVGCTPSPSMLTGLAQNALYFVYYIDPNFAGGTITPIATQNASDFLNKAGYLLIGQIVTPTYAPLYRPSTYTDVGTIASVTPAAAYDGNIATDALVQGQWWTQGGMSGYTYPSYTGDCYWGGFPNITLGSSATLNVNITPTVGPATVSGMGVLMEVNVYLNGVLQATLGTYSTGGSEVNLTWTVPSGTNISQITVEGKSSCTPPSGYSGTSGAGQCGLEAWEIWIQ